MSDLVDLHAAAPTADRVLYQVVHPSDMELDRWTQDYTEAVAIFRQFTRDYGGAHLHAVTLHAGQYYGECLIRTETGAAS